LESETAVSNLRASWNQVSNLRASWNQKLEEKSNVEHKNTANPEAIRAPIT
jgi:hypothetical protein